jgi:hypothetical protein
MYYGPGTGAADAYFTVQTVDPTPMRTEAAVQKKLSCFFHSIGQFSGVVEL